MKKIFMAIESGVCDTQISFRTLEDNDIKEFFNEQNETEFNWDTMTEEQKEDWFIDCDRNEFDAFLGLDHFTTAYEIKPSKQVIEELDNARLIIQEMMKNDNL